MSNHYSAANLRFPGDDARLDFTDIYAWLTNGKISSDGLMPHDDLLDQFPTSARPISTQPGNRGSVGT